jgi:hypothetical protein
MRCANVTQYAFRKKKNYTVMAFIQLDHVLSIKNFV